LSGRHHTYSDRIILASGLTFRVCEDDRIIWGGALDVHHERRTRRYLINGGVAQHLLFYRFSEGHHRGMAERNGVHIRSVALMKTAFPLMLFSIFIAMLYLLVHYF